MIIDMHKIDGKKIRIWQAETRISDELGCAELVTRYGAKDGKITERVALVKAKNVGHANETTPILQARFEALSKARGKLDENYILSDPDQVRGVEGFEGNGKHTLLPMLAQKFEISSLTGAKLINVQPKIDGHRCIARMENGKVLMTTRKGKEYTIFPEIERELEQIFAVTPDIILDGELYIPGWDFNDISSAIKKRGIDTPKVMYLVFDCINQTPFVHRACLIHRVLIGAGLFLKHCVPVSTTPVSTMEEIKIKHESYISRGYEGTIVRVDDCMYQLDTRSNQLLKHKDFADAEFIIIGGESELLQNGQEGIIYRVKDDDNGCEFTVRPKGDMAKRVKWLESLKDNIGKRYTVRFQGRSKDGVPRFPVGVGIRDID